MEFIPSLLLFASIAAITPGPNNIMIMSSGLNFGVRSSLPHYFGICIGFPLLLTTIGFGAGYVFENHPVFHQVFQVVAILYLVYLSWLVANSTAGNNAPGSGQPIGFVKSALFQWVNPKAWVMGSSAIATYTTTEAELSSQLTIIVVIFTVTTAIAVGIWMVFGVALQRALSSHRRRKSFNFLMALLLLASIAPAMVSVVAKWLS